jgi:GTP-binding protein EngB required for normal cell division
MRITVDIDESKIYRIIKETGQKKKSPALAQALDEFLENRKRKKFLVKVMDGKTDYAVSNEEIEDLWSLER